MFSFVQVFSVFLKYHFHVHKYMQNLHSSGPHEMVFGPSNLSVGFNKIIQFFALTAKKMTQFAPYLP